MEDFKICKKHTFSFKIQSHLVSHWASIFSGKLQVALSCGGDFKFSRSQEEYLISSPGFPSHSYPPATQCFWTIETLEYHDIQVTTDAAQFRGTPSADCSSSDKLQFKTATNTALAVICNQSNNVYKIEKPKFVLHFQATATGNSSDFIYGFSIRLKGHILLLFFNLEF
jgi:CUB domain